MRTPLAVVPASLAFVLLASLHADELVVTPRLRAPAADGVKCEIALTSPGNAARQMAPLRAGDPALFAVPAGSSWYAGTVGKDCYATERFVIVSGRTSLALDVWPTRQLAGTLDPSSATNALTAHFTSVEDGILSGSVPCSIEGAAWRCRVPATRLDIALRAEGLAPLYIWDAAAPADLGVLHFDRGSSLTGRLRTDDASVTWKDVRLELWSGGDLRKTIAPNDRGFFHAAALTAGTYTLIARAPGWSPLERMVLVHEGREAVMRGDLVLTRPRRMAIAVTPPADPWERPWRVTVSRLDRGNRISTEIRDAKVDELGIARFTDLESGSYAIKVRRDASTVWASRMIELNEDAHIDIDVPLRKVAGSVTLRDELLPATIWFGGRGGSPSVMVSTKTGSFRTILPAVHDDVWKTVEIASDARHIQRTLSNVRLTGASDSDERRVELVLPDHRISGEVVHADGSPASGGSVLVTMKGEPLLEASVDEGGIFQLLGLAAGTVHLRARTKGMNSDAVEATIDDDQPYAPFVRLVLRDDRIIEGSVLSGTAPVSGARVLISAPGTQSHVSGQVVTDEGGHFRGSVPAEARHVNLYISAPGHARKVVHWTADSAQPLRVALEQTNGKLHLTLPIDGEALLTTLFVGMPEANITLKQLMSYFGDRMIATESGPNVRLTFLDMPEGSYSICEGRQCANGYLPRFADLALSLPRRE